MQSKRIYQKSKYSFKTGKKFLKPIKFIHTSKEGITNHQGPKTLWLPKNILTSNARMSSINKKNTTMDARDIL